VVPRTLNLLAPLRCGAFLSGAGTPLITALPRRPGLPQLLLRDEKNCSKGRNYKGNLGNVSLSQRRDRTAVSDIAAAVKCGIGIEDLALWSATSIVSSSGSRATCCLWPLARHPEAGRRARSPLRLRHAGRDIGTGRNDDPRSPRRLPG
jgi:hypothetical protein